MSNGSTHAFFVISKEKFKTTLQCIPTKYLNWTQFSIAFETKYVGIYEGKTNFESSAKRPYL